MRTRKNNALVIFTRFLYSGCICERTSKKSLKNQWDMSASFSGRNPYKNRKWTYLQMSPQDDTLDAGLLRMKVSNINHIDLWKYFFTSRFSYFTLNSDLIVLLVAISMKIHLLFGCKQALTDTFLLYSTLRSCNATWLPEDTA